jgi:hypothetical protein
MDEQFEQMRTFTHQLIEFNARLKASVRDLKEKHNQVSPLWQDEMRRYYDAVWEPFEETMDHYLAVEAPNYVEFLEIKLHALRGYLFGGRQ